MVKFVMLIVAVLSYVHSVNAGTCPVRFIEKCEALFIKSEGLISICRRTELFERCISSYEDRCTDSPVYLHARYLIKKNNFLSCTCPEEMIYKFLTAFYKSDMCSKQFVLRQVVEFFTAPSCIKNRIFQKAAKLQRLLKRTC